MAIMITGGSTDPLLRLTGRRDVLALGSTARYGVVCVASRHAHAFIAELDLKSVFVRVTTLFNNSSAYVLGGRGVGGRVRVVCGLR